VIDDQVIARSGNVVYLQGHGSEGMVYLTEAFGSAALGQQILAAVAPTGQSC
jgi:hypothetical protein